MNQKAGSTKTLLLPRDMRDKQGFKNYVQRTCLKKNIYLPQIKCIVSLGYKVLLA
jgi:hypothetical protein